MLSLMYTKIGEIGIAEENGFIIGLYLPGAIIPEIETGSTELLREAFSQLDLYFEGKLTKFSLPLAPKGTPFMQSVWSELKKIPYGETASYKDIAVRIGNEKAVRAVGQANNRNPIPILIPCHRVIGTNGKLVGYAGGLKIKERLLNLENENRINF